MKGLCVGTAEVSTKHVNFIIDTGNASASVRLTDDVQVEVERFSGIRLIPEVHRVGAFSS
jgi:UDP-N-acetylmuramate dehydrogenase